MNLGGNWQTYGDLSSDKQCASTHGRGKTPTVTVQYHSPGGNHEGT